jgi:hypothetical protein
MPTMLFGQAYINDGPSGPKMERERGLGTPAERSPKTLDDRNTWGTLERYPVSLVPIILRSECVSDDERPQPSLSKSNLGQDLGKRARFWSGPARPGRGALAAKLAAQRWIIALLYLVWSS